MEPSIDLSNRISQLIDRYIANEADPKLRTLATEKKVLPLYRSMADVVSIDANGNIISFLWDDTSRGQIEHDPRIRNVALFQGSKEYPELKVLIEKPEDARVCPHCKGTGIAPYAEKLKTDALVCFCGGLGWIPNNG